MDAVQYNQICIAFASVVLFVQFHHMILISDSSNCSHFYTVYVR